MNNRSSQTHKPYLYLAGKIGKNDFRHRMVPGLRGHEWRDGPIDAGQYLYVGPFFKSCDHGCNHNPNGHGAASGFHVGESPYNQADVIRNNNAALKQADLVFAYITSPDCYGTLIEIGSATRAGQRVVMAFAPGMPHYDFWYAKLQSVSVHYEIRECCLPGLISKELEALK